MRVLMETFTKSQFGYCPLAWMICVGKANSRINHLHKQALRIVHKNKDLSFDELLKKKKKKKKKNGSFAIHHRYYQYGFSK